MSFASNAVALQSSKLCQQAAMLGSTAILARSVGASGIGIFAGLIALAVIVQAVASLGYEDLVLALGPRLGGDGLEASSVYAATLFRRLLAASALTLSALAAGILGWAGPRGSSGWLVACALIYAAFNGIATLGASIQACRVRAGQAAFIDAAWAFVVLTSYAVLASRGELTLVSAMVTYAGSQVVAGLVYMGCLRRMLWAQRSLRRTPALKRWPAFWLNGIMNTGLGKSSDILVMGALAASTAAIGEYNAAFSIALLASTVLTQGAGTMTYVAMGRAHRSGGPRATRWAWSFSVRVASILSLPPLVFCLFFPSATLSLLYGAGFDSAREPLQLLCGLLILSRIFGGGANQGLLFLSGRENFVVVVRASVLAINLVLDAALLVEFGTSGVAFASGVSALLLSVFEYIGCRRPYKLQVPYVAQAKILLIFGVLSLTFAIGTQSPVPPVELLLTATAVTLLGAGALVLTKPLEWPPDVSLVPGRGLGRVILTQLARGPSARAAG